MQTLGSVKNTTPFLGHIVYKVTKCGFTFCVNVSLGLMVYVCVYCVRFSFFTDMPSDWLG